MNLHPAVAEKVRQVLEALAEGRCEVWMAAYSREALSSFRSAAAPKKPAIASVAHHDGVRRAEELQDEEVRAATWVACCARSRIDHLGALACEACHRHATTTVGMEPHHLVLGERTDAPELVMVLCPTCHRTGPRAAHRTPRVFAHDVVIPWARAHGYGLPNRKEYRDVHP